MAVIKKTDLRMIIDIPLPGYKPENIKVTSYPGDCEIKVSAKIKPKRQENRSLGYYKKVSNFKETFAVDSGRFDMENIEVSFDNGLVRIVVPKLEEYLGTVIHPDDESEEE